MNALIHVTGWTLVHFVWQGVFIAFATATALRLLRSAPSQARYAVACAALAAMLASPLITARLLSGSPPVVPANGNPPHVSSREAPPAASLPGVSVTGVRNAVAARTMGPDVDMVQPPFDSLLSLVVVVWLAGVSSLLIRLAGGWWRIQRLHQASLTMAASRWQAASEGIALRLGLRRGAYVVDSDLVDTPIVVGWLRPVILLPIAALANLTPAQVNAILAHELAHVRRHDSLVNLLQNVTETLLFYHPAVWWVSARIRAEREHCCDEVAVEVCGDAVGYAAALAELETRRTEQTTLAMASTGGSLLDRVRRVLRVPVDGDRRSSNAAMVAALALVLVIAAGSVKLLPVMQTGEPGTAMDDSRGFGPREVNERLGFELFPGPRDPHGDPRGAVAWTMDFDDPSGGMSFKGFTGRGLIRFAYQVPNSPILEGPSWIDTESIDLSTTLGSAPSADDWPLVVRQLLEERLKLTTHHETRDLPVYALVVANPDGTLGPNLRPSTSACFDFDAWRAAGSPRSALRGQRDCGPDGGLTGMSFHKVTMAELAQYLSRPGPLLDRVVVDRTGLARTFDLDLELGLLPAAVVMSRHPATAVFLAPLGVRTIFSALPEQLGLRLDEATAPSDVLVIDHAELESLKSQVSSLK